MKKIKCMIGFLEVDKNQNEALIEFLVKNKIQFHVIKANDEYIKENLKLESDKDKYKNAWDELKEDCKEIEKDNDCVLFSRLDELEQKHGIGVV